VSAYPLEAIRDGGARHRSSRPADERAHLHDCRHAGLTLAAQSGATLRELMALGGHSTPRAALIYQKASRDRAAEVAGTISTRLARMRPRPIGTTGGVAGGTAEGTSDLAGTRRARKAKNGHH
jgi:hypothetical protein